MEFSTDENIPPTSESINEALGNENRGAEQGDANQQAEAPRKIAGLVAGRIVNFVMKGGCLRPLLIVRVPADGIGIVNGVLFFDGLNDIGNFPATLGAPLVRDSYGRTLSSLWASGVGYDETGDLEGTWHWPTKQAVVASGIDAAAFNVLLDARVAQIEADLTEKLNKTVESVNAALDSNNKLLRELLTPGHLIKGEAAVESLAAGLNEAAGEPEAASGQQAESATGGAGN